MVAYQEIIDIIRRRIESMNEEQRSKAEKDDVLGLIEETLDLIRTGTITEEQAFYTILGIAWDYMIPLTPRDIKKIREALGIPPR